MSNKEITWLQMSDLHIFESVDWLIMKEQYKRLAEKVRPNFITITGDLKDFIEKENSDYSKTLSFLNDVLRIFDVDKKDVFIIPGNHDVNDFFNREMNIEAIKARKEKAENFFDDEKNDAKLYDAFKNYKTFIKNFYGNSINDVNDQRVEDPEKVLCLKWQGKLNIILLNSALISNGVRDHDEIIDIKALGKINEKIDKKLPSIVLCHHNLQDIRASQRKRMIKLFEIYNVKACLCGDSHKLDIKYIDKFNLDEINIPCIVCGKSAVEVDDKYSDVGIILYTWKNDNNVYVKPYKFTGLNFKESDDFVININEDYNFTMNTNNLLEEKTTYNQQEEANKLCLKKYSDITEAHKDIADDIRNSDFFFFYGLRGATFIGDPEINVIVKELKTGSNPGREIRFLISYPFSEKVGQRLKAIPDYKDDCEREEKWRNTFKKINDLQTDYKNRENVHIRFHDTPLIFRLLFTEKHLYLGYYEPEKDSVHTEIFQFDKESPTYKTYLKFYNNQWIIAKRKIPAEIPSNYSFLNETFIADPSLVINITSQCNMNCIYCPTGGENLIEINQNECISKDSLQKLVLGFGEVITNKKGKPILRITGGEPLINNETREKVINIFNSAQKYEKIIFCTNAMCFEEAYNENIREWESVKSKLTLKISLDTIDKYKFNGITTGKLCNNEKISNFDIVIKNIKFAKSKGFRIEINLVATQYNIQEKKDIIDVFEFAQKLGLVGVKVLTVNDFGGKVTIGQTKKEKEQIGAILKEVIEYMKKCEYEEVTAYSHGNKGIQMRRFIARSDKDEVCTLTIVDHNAFNTSITPVRTFSDFCSSCRYYFDSKDVKKGLVQPCNTGIMSLTLRADGLLCPCRLRTDAGRDIKDVSTIEEMKKIIGESLGAFQKCFHINIKEGKL